LAITTSPALQAQLAITEVMSSASTNLGPGTARADFWELTNFGTNVLDLTDYRFNDSGGIDGAEAAMFQGVSIHPGESIVFAQVTDVVCTNAAQFRAWWGDTNLPSGLQVHFYTKRGFASLGADAVQFWHVTAASTTLVDRVDLYVARNGFTFTYDPLIGVLDGVSVAGENGAFKAAETDDVGSPGFTVGPVPLVITQQPQSLTVDAGTPATFSVQATGLPRARPQWRFNGANLSGATASTWCIAAAQPTDAGTYTAELNNGVEVLVSAPAALEVNDRPAPPRIVVPPADLSVTPGQTAIFSVSVRGYPLPTFQWAFNGTNLLDATNSTFSIRDVNFDSAGTYSVRIENPLGSTNAAALLTVRPKPNLVITEMMGSHSTNTTVSGHADWWELTNFDTNAVNLRGYRFDDYPGVLEGAVVITNDVILQPGEAVVFFQDMTPEAFTSWWGEENLPEHVQFVRYVGNGFQSQYDSVTLWNATALEPEDIIARAEYVHLNPDFTPVRGISLTFWCDGWIEFGRPSVLGECGGIRAAESDDIGSPGYLTNHPPRTVAPRCLQIACDAQGAQLTWRTQAGKRYELQCRPDLAAADWIPLSQHSAGGTQLETEDATAAAASRRFYRLVVLPDPP
jgi:hypothetical protein